MNKSDIRSNSKKNNMKRIIVRVREIERERVGEQVRVREQK